MNANIKWLDGPGTSRAPDPFNWLGSGALGVFYGPGVAPAIPYGCWDKVGFKECHNKEFALAQSLCADGAWEAAGYGSYNNCVNNQAGWRDHYNCLPSCKQCSAPKTWNPSTGYCDDQAATPCPPMGGYSDDIKTLQAQLNTKLASEGYLPIATDGKLGPATCGAAQEVWPEMVCPTCTSFTKPTKSGLPPTPKPPEPKPPEVIPPTPTTASGSGWGPALLAAAGIALLAWSAS